MSTTAFALLCAVTVTVSISSAVIVYFVVKLAAGVSRLNASNNVWEYGQMERAASIASKRVTKDIDPETPSGQTAGDGSLTDVASEKLSHII